jgi:3-hydroxybutyryl-CoA dehydratase
MNAETASTGYYFEDLAIGMSADFRRVIGDEEMRLFADLTGDTNPLHFDDDFAERSRFGGRIVHGMCTAALISTVIGTRLPGPGCIYLSQTLRFTAPVRPGDEIVARAVVDRLIPERRRVEFETTCSVGDQIVLAGRALAQVPSRTGPA